MGKVVFHEDDARKRVLAGAELLYNAVKTTMGPKGRNVIIGEQTGQITVTHDGVTVARAIELDNTKKKNLGQRVGADLIRQVANKMNDVAGDGTTTVTVLTYHILNEANKLVAAGYNPMLLRKGLEAATAEILNNLPDLAENIKSSKQRIAEVATISAGDKEIGDLIADVIDNIGKAGIVTVEESQGLQLESEVVEGFTTDRGFISPYMITNQAKMEAVYDKPAIVITDKPLSNLQEILPLIEKLIQTGQKEVLLIAEDVTGEVLGTLIINKMKGMFNTVAIKAPGYGDRRKEILEDIAILTGATVISEDKGMTFDTVDKDVVGSARRVIVKQNETTIVEGRGNPIKLDDRIKLLDEQIEDASSEYEKEHLEKRRAALSGKVAVIKVGGATETEIEEKTFRVEDAVHAVKAALEEGIVAGGGVTLINLASSLKKSDDAGHQLLVRALDQPFRILMENAGLNPDEWLAQVKAGKIGFGINVNKPGELIDLKIAGIIDPARVTKEAIQNAVSIAGTAMTMGALVVDEPEKQPVQPQPGM